MKRMKKMSKFQQQQKKEKKEKMMSTLDGKASYKFISLQFHTSNQNNNIFIGLY